MTTAAQLFDRALERIRVKDPRQDAEESDVATCISVLNDMMLEWHETGIWLGYAIISEAQETITAPDWSHGAIKANLALRLCDEYGREASVQLYEDADRGMRLLRSKTTHFASYLKPSTMPRGSGNLGHGRANQSEHYPNAWADDLASGSGQPLADETGTTLDIDPDDL